MSESNGHPPENDNVNGCPPAARCEPDKASSANQQAAPSLSPSTVVTTDAKTLKKVKVLEHIIVGREKIQLSYDVQTVNVEDDPALWERKAHEMQKSSETLLKAYEKLAQLTGVSVANLKARKIVSFSHPKHLALSKALSEVMNTNENTALPTRQQLLHLVTKHTSLTDEAAESLVDEIADNVHVSLRHQSHADNKQAVIDAKPDYVRTQHLAKLMEEAEENEKVDADEDANEATTDETEQVEVDSDSAPLIDESVFKENDLIAERNMKAAKERLEALPSMEDNEMDIAIDQSDSGDEETDQSEDNNDDDAAAGEGGTVDDVEDTVDDDKAEVTVEHTEQQEVQQLLEATLSDTDAEDDGSSEETCDGAEDCDQLQTQAHGQGDGDGDGHMIGESNDGEGGCKHEDKDSHPAKKRPKLSDGNDDVITLD